MWPAIPMPLNTRPGNEHEPMAPGEMHKDVNDTDKTIELVVVELK